MITKRCSNCKEHKEYEYYSKNRSKPDNMQDRCKECIKLFNVVYRDTITAHSKRYNIENRAALSVKRRKYYLDNMETSKAQMKVWASNNPDKINAISARRKARQLQAIPKWTTDVDKWMIEEAYELAQLRQKLTGIKWHVDHIVPLKGKTVCGLHVPNNLQVITAHANQVKGSSF